MPNPLKNLSIGVPLIGMPGRFGRGNNVRPAANNAETPRRHPLSHIPEIFRAFMRPDRRNAGNQGGIAVGVMTTTTTTAAALPYMLPPLHFGADTTSTPPAPTSTITNNTTNNAADGATDGATDGRNQRNAFGSYHYMRPRQQMGKSQLYDLIADKYRRFQPGTDTLNDKDPRPEAFKKLTPMARYIFFKKLTPPQRTTLMDQLMPDEQIELATARHLDKVGTLLADANIRALSRQLASQPRYNRDPELVQKYLDRIYKNLIFTPPVANEDLLTDREQYDFLRELHDFAPDCQSQYWNETGVKANPGQAYSTNPGIAQTSAYTLPLEKPRDPVKSRLTLSVAPKDALKVAREIVRLQDARDPSMANTSELKIIGPAEQGKRYDSIVVYFAGWDPDGAKTLAENLHNALPNVNWLKIDNLMLDEISEGCGYGEHYIRDTSLADEHATVFGDTLIDLASDPTRTHYQTLRQNLGIQRRDLFNPALVRRG